MDGAFDWATIAVQIPLVAAFIWFSLESQKRFQCALDKRDEEFEKRNNATCNSLDSLTRSVTAMTERLIAHDVRVQPAVDKIASMKFGKQE
jgi:hypothetical protein